MQTCKQLLNDNDELDQSAVNLILTGSATPFLHNDVISYDDDGEVLVSC